MKILIDTNIVLDLLLEREPFVEEAIALFELVETAVSVFLRGAQPNGCDRDTRSIRLCRREFASVVDRSITITSEPEILQ